MRFGRNTPSIMKVIAHVKIAENMKRAIYTGAFIWMVHLAMPILTGPTGGAA